jgi:hypothetical protein
MPDSQLSIRGHYQAAVPHRDVLRLEQEVDAIEESGSAPDTQADGIGTRELAGLFTIMVMVNNWDIKTSQHAIYRVSEKGDAQRQWYVVKDLGASLGRTNWYIPGERDDREAFVEERFIESAEGNRAKFHYKGAWLEPQLTTSVTPGDVVWICQLHSQLTDRQWMDAFQAGGYSPADARRYIQRMQEKIDEGLRLGERQP